MLNSVQSDTNNITLTTEEIVDIIESRLDNQENASIPITETSNITGASNRLEFNNIESQTIDFEEPGGIFWLCHVFATYGRQMDASLSGQILLFGHGLQFIWTLNTMQRYHEQGIDLTFWGKITILAYYMGAIFGNVIGAVLITTIQKKCIYNLGGGLSLLTAIFYMMAEWHQDFIILGRIAAGIAYGLIYITTIIHTSEAASKEFRHLLVLNVGYTFGLSSLIMAVITISTYALDGLHNNVALATFVCSSIALVFNYSSTQESPIYLLQQTVDNGNGSSSESAFEAFRVLQKRGMHISEISRRFSQLKEYVSEATVESRNILSHNNIITMTLVCCIRFTTALSLNIGIIFIALNMEFIFLPNSGLQTFRTAFLIWLVCGTATLFLFYRSRNYVYIAAMVFGIISTINILVLILAIDFVIIIFMQIIVVALRAYIICFTLPLEILGGVYLSEAFTLAKKPISMAVVLCIDNLTHILMTFFVLEKLFIPFWFITSLSLIGLGLKLCWSIPKDTHKMTLQESANAFSNVSAREWYTKANLNSRIS